MAHQLNKITGLPRVSLLRVPVDIVEPDKLPDVVRALVDSGASHQIVLLSQGDLLLARRNAEYRSYVTSASLVIPISKSLIRGARFLCGSTPVRYMPFDFVVQLLTSLESGSRSIYLLGARRRSLQTAEWNIRHTFPGLRIVGRYAGWFRKPEEPKILTAIRKASPSVLLVAKGVPGGERWILRNLKAIGPGIHIWCSDLFDVFAERKKRPSRAIFDRGLEGITSCFRRPWRLVRLFPYIYYNYLLLFYKVFRREG